MKLTREDIKKYGTLLEQKILLETLENDILSFSIDRSWKNYIEKILNNFKSKGYIDSWTESEIYTYIQFKIKGNSKNLSKVKKYFDDIKNS
jgi:ribosomal protein S8